MDGFHRMVNDFDLVWMVNGWIFIEISLDSGDLCRAGAKRARGHWRRDEFEPFGTIDGFSSTGRWYLPSGILWLFNIAMENGPFIDSLPIKNGDFPWLC